MNICPMHEFCFVTFQKFSSRSTPSMFLWGRECGHSYTAFCWTSYAIYELFFCLVKMKSGEMGFILQPTMIVRCAQKCGHCSLYQDDEAVKLLIWRAIILPLLPVDDMSDVWFLTLKQTDKEELYTEVYRLHDHILGWGQSRTWFVEPLWHHQAMNNKSHQGMAMMVISGSRPMTSRWLTFWRRSRCTRKHSLFGWKVAVDIDLDRVCTGV